MEDMYWSVDGSFITDLARVWFWNENRPYERVEELLLNCMVTDAITLDEKKRYIQDIIEGRLKLTGVNELSLEEDNENIRPISLKVEEYRKKEILRDIKEDMELHPLYYIDLYAAEKTLCLEDLEEEFSEYKRQKGFIGADEDMIEEFLCTSYNSLTGRFTYDEPERTDLRKGLYLMNPLLVYKLFEKPLSKIDEEKKYKKLYEYMKESEQTKDVIKRQKLYEAYLNECLETKETKKAEFPDEQRRRLKEFTESLGRKVDPDEFNSEYGLINKMGEYYSCGFAEHEVKAMQIIIGNPESFGISREDERIVNQDLSENWLDILYNDGWIIIRNPYVNSAPYIDIAPGKRATKYQIDTVFNYMAHFKRSRMSGLDELMKD